MTTKLMILPFATVKASPDLQIRAVVRGDVVDMYLQWILGGSLPPPMKARVTSDGTYLQADGAHRRAALERAGKTEYTFEIEPGERVDVLLDACRLNIGHGLHLSNIDKRRATELLMAEKEGFALSNRQIAERTGLSHPTVGDIREEMYGMRDASEQQPTILTDDPRSYVPLQIRTTPDPALSYGESTPGWDGSPVEVSRPMTVTGQRGRGGGGNGSGITQPPPSMRPTTLVITWLLPDGDSGSIDLVEESLNDLPTVVRQTLRSKLRGDT